MAKRKPKGTPENGEAGPPDKVVDRFPEWKLQEAIGAAFDAEGYVWAADMAGVRLAPSLRRRMEAQGMKSGEPDLRVYLSRGRVVLIELKADGGSLSAAQKARHALLAALGHVVRVLKATIPAEAVEKALRIVREAEAA